MAFFQELRVGQNPNQDGGGRKVRKFISVARITGTSGSDRVTAPTQVSAVSQLLNYLTRQEEYSLFAPALQSRGQDFWSPFLENITPHSHALIAFFYPNLYLELFKFPSLFGITLILVAVSLFMLVLSIAFPCASKISEALGVSHCSYKQMFEWFAVFGHQPYHRI